MEERAVGKPEGITMSTVTTQAYMASQRVPRRKSTGAEGESLAPVALSKNFGEEEDIMEIDSPTQSLKKLLEKKQKFNPEA